MHNVHDLHFTECLWKMLTVPRMTTNLNAVISAPIKNTAVSVINVNNFFCLLQIRA